MSIEFRIYIYITEAPKNASHYPKKQQFTSDRGVASHYVNTTLQEVTNLYTTVTLDIKRGKPHNNWTESKFCDGIV